MGRARRLAKDYEVEYLYSEAMVYLASTGSLLRRLGARKDVEWTEQMLAALDRAADPAR